MIARLWFGRTNASKSEEYSKYMKKTGIKDLRETEGNRGVLMFKRLNNNVVEFYIISFWESKDSIRRFAGEDINKAVYYPEDINFLLEMEPELKHYEVEAAPGIFSNTATGS
ncbi:MAG TPA: antibiotic biosynthesis monooxygenase [Acidobacteriota bacterium]|nr:antibiotic biosynthesis monooxygenase [Acidobacteriota bacterium]